jgi:hypothetical protein
MEKYMLQTMFITPFTLDWSGKLFNYIWKKSLVPDQPNQHHRQLADQSLTASKLEDL